MLPSWPCSIPRRIQTDPPPTLTTQRGDIDAGGLRYVLVRYGNFFQLVLPVPGGHVSIALESQAVGVELLEPISAVLGGDHGLIG
jgi:hypothetical protein